MKDLSDTEHAPWFVNEQVEEEANAEEIVQKLRLIQGERGGGGCFTCSIRSWDRESSHHLPRRSDSGLTQKQQIRNVPQFSAEKKDGKSHDPAMVRDLFFVILYARQPVNAYRAACRVAPELDELLY